MSGKATASAYKNKHSTSVQAAACSDTSVTFDAKSDSLVRSLLETSETSAEVMRFAIAVAPNLLLHTLGAVRRRGVDNLRQTAANQ
jgi:hypothetical protein